jgi:hypothetical protein
LEIIGLLNGCTIERVIPETERPSFIEKGLELVPHETFVKSKAEKKKKKL